MIKQITLGEIILAVLIVGIALFVIPNIRVGVSPQYGDSGYPNQYSTATNSSVSCLATSTAVIVSGNGTRKFAYITNPNSTGVYVCLASSCTSGTGVYLGQGNSFRIDNNSLYTGAMSCVSSATTTLAVSYKQ